MMLRNLSFKIFLATIGGMIAAFPTQAAEQVILKYSVLEETFSVAQLSSLAYRGEVSPELERFLEKANQNPEELQQILTEPVDVDAVVLSKTLNSVPGEFLLDRASEIVHTPSERASRQSLRGAMVSSAVPDGNIRIIEVLENDPTDEVYVEGDRLVELYTTIDEVVGHLDNLEGIIDKL